MTEEETLRQYSTPGLRKKELTRNEHKTRLQDLNLPKEVIEEILDQAHGVTE